MTLFHCTCPSYAESILRDGFDPSQYARLGVHTYLSSTPQYVFGNTCLAVNVDGLNITQTVNVWEYITSDYIASDRITYYGYNDEFDE